MDTTLGIFVENRNPAITVNDTDSAESVLSRMSFYDITSLPVVSAVGSVVGMITALDILGYVSYQSLETADLSLPIGDLLRTSRENQDGGVYLYEATESVASLLKPFSLSVHRALVRVVNQHQEVDKKGFRLVSQTDILRYCNELHEKPWMSVKEMSLKDLGIINTNPVSCETSKSATDAFRLIDNTQVAAVCVVDEVVANLSASDLRGTNARKLQKLHLPVLEFLQAHHGFVPSPITAKETDTLDASINKCLESHIHRLWVVDDNEKLIGVVSLTDFFIAISSAYNK